MNTLTITEDGCHSMVSEKFGVSYHSIHGALIETDTVYINMGLRFLVEKGMSEITIFEMGFGTGLNAIRTYNVAEELGLRINYTTVEAYPLVESEYSQLNFHDILGKTSNKQLSEMHGAASHKKVMLSDTFCFTKIIGKIEDFETHEKFDLIYYDAFDPETQPFLWEAAMMQKMHDLLNGTGILVTYCAKGAFKRVLKSLNFYIDCLPGPGRKREITRAKIMEL
jgi:tRNA U34 5-methylaminomethyl-2-thiouridine-forming methyltransferase MnmC